MGEAGWGNLLPGAAVMLAAFVVSFGMARFVGYEQPDRETLDEITGAKTA